uniref:Uncharacterized protein n=1 Tax=Cannabis sativa TaxID=3483 RepID=A0A803PD30_CANSA
MALVSSARRVSLVACRSQLATLTCSSSVASTPTSLAALSASRATCQNRSSQRCQSIRIRSRILKEKERWKKSASRPYPNCLLLGRVGQRENIHAAAGSLGLHGQLRGTPSHLVQKLSSEGGGLSPHLVCQPLLKGSTSTVGPTGGKACRLSQIFAL